MIRGVSREVELNVSYLGEWLTPWWEEEGGKWVDKGPKVRAGFVAKTRINRHDFGVRPLYGSLRELCTRFERASCGGLHSNRVQEFVEVVDKALVESIELVAFVLSESGVGSDGAEQASRERRIDALEELQEDDADRVALGEQAIASGVRHLLNEALGPELREVVAQRSQSIRIGGRVEGGRRGGMEIAHRERVTSGNVREADERMHERELAGMIQFQAGNPLAVGEVCGFGEVSQLAAVHEGLEDVLLDREIPVGDGHHRVAQRRQVFDGFRDAEVPDVVGRGFGPQGQVIPHVLFDGPVAAIAADNRIREIEVFDDGFELAAVPLRDLPAEDRREFRRLADRAIRIEQALAERVKGRAPIED